jgi:pimeloyl-ACP methyl ester carboxylesterase
MVSAAAKPRHGTSVSSFNIESDILFMVGVRETMLAVPVRTRDYRLATWFRDAGDELVVFLHGLGCSKDNWRHAWALRELRDKSLLGLDFLGFGHSPRPAHFGYKLEDHVAVVTAVIDSHALKRIHVVAHSMGGTIALLLPERTLSRLQSLILVEPRLLEASCGIGAEAAKFTYEEFMSGAFAWIQRRVSNDQKAAYDLKRADPAAFYHSSCSLVDWTRGRGMLDRFEAAPCRKVFIYGAENRYLEELGEISSDLKMEIGNSSHFVMRDNPDDFYRQSAAFMAAAL